MPLLSTLRWRTGDAPWQASWFLPLSASLSVPLPVVDLLAGIDVFTLTAANVKSEASQPTGRPSTPVVPYVLSATTWSTCTAVSAELFLIVNLTLVEPPGYSVSGSVTSVIVTPAAAPTVAEPEPVPEAVKYATAIPATAIAAIATTGTRIRLRISVR